MYSLKNNSKNKSFWIVIQKLLFLYFIVTLLFSTGVL